MQSGFELLAANPDPPSDLTVMTSSWESVALAWSAGFDGGRQQTFTVTYAVWSATGSSDWIQAVMTNTTQLNITGYYYWMN